MHVRDQLRWEVVALWVEFPSHRSPNRPRPWRPILLPSLPIRGCSQEGVGQRFLAALLYLSHLNQWLARPKPKEMITKSACFGIEANALESVMLRILHVLAVVSCSILDKRRGIESTFPQSLSFANHLTVIVGVQPIYPLPYQGMTRTMFPTSARVVSFTRSFSAEKWVLTLSSMRSFVASRRFCE